MSDPKSTCQVRQVETNGTGNLLVPITVYDEQTSAIIDTAAQATIMSSKLAQKLVKSLKYGPRFSLKGPNMGAEIPAQLCKLVEIGIGRHTFHWDVFVADIRDDFILGLDFLTNFGLDISLLSNSLIIGSENIPIKRGIQTDGCR